MSRVLGLAKRLVHDEDGAALVEYTVLLGLILVAVIALIVSVGSWVNIKWTLLNTAITGN